MSDYTESITVTTIKKAIDGFLLSCKVEGRSYGTIDYIPDVEGPARLVKALTKIAKGLCAVRGNLRMTSQDYEIVRKLALDTVPGRRIKIVQYLSDKEWHRPKRDSQCAFNETINRRYDS